MSVIPGWFPGASQKKNPTVNFLGAAFTAVVTGTTGNFVIPAASMGPASPKRQFAIFVSMSSSSLSAATFNGSGQVISPHRLDTGGNAWDGWITGFWPTNVDLTVALTIAGSIGSETFQCAVWEIYDAKTLSKCPIYTGVPSAGFVTNGVHVPRGGCVIAAAQKGAFSSTWTGLTEVVDSFVGSNVGITAAQNNTPALNPTDLNIDVLNITGAEGSVLVIPPDYLPFVGIQLLDVRGRTGSGTTITITAAELPTELRGSFTLLVGVSLEKDSSPVTGGTYGGNAMTLLGTATNISAGDNDPHVALLGINVVNDSPTGDVVINVPNGINTFTTFVTCWAIYDATGFGTVETATGNAIATAQCDVDVGERGAIVAIVARNGDTQSASWTGAVELNDIDQGANRAGSAYVGLLEAQTNRPIIVTPSGGSDNMAMIAVAINR